MKLSHGLKLMLEPLQGYYPCNLIPLFEAMRKAGKRGKAATLYPTDLKQVKVILEVVHDVTEKLFSVEVENGNIQDAMIKLANFVKDEDFVLENRYACY